jgi:hypothetical protein
MPPYPRTTGGQEGSVTEPPLVYVICPVPPPEPDGVWAVSSRVSKLEEAGWNVYWPYRDVPHDQDINSYQAFLETRVVLQRADVVALWWNPASARSGFDIGTAWTLYQPLMLLNPSHLVPGRQLDDLLARWAEHSKERIAALEGTLTQ